MIQAKTMLGMVTTAALFGSGHASIELAEPPTKASKKLKWFTFKESDIFTPNRDFICRGVTTNSIQDSNINTLEDDLGLYGAGPYVGSRGVKAKELRLNEPCREVHFKMGQKWKICAAYDIYRKRENTGNKICCIFKLGGTSIDNLFWMESSRIVTHFECIEDKKDDATWKDDTYDLESAPEESEDSEPEPRIPDVGDFDSEKVRTLIDRLDQDGVSPAEVLILDSASTDEQAVVSLIEKHSTNGLRRTRQSRKKPLAQSLGMITEAPDADDSEKSGTGTGSADEDEKRSQASTPPPTDSMDALKDELLKFALANETDDLTETDPRAGPADAPVAAARRTISAATYFHNAGMLKKQEPTDAAAEKGQDIDNVAL